MVKVGVAEYDVILSQQKVEAELARTTATLERGMGAAASKIDAEFSRTFKRIAAGYGLFAAGRGIGNSIKEASDLTEQQGKVGLVFESSAREVEKFADSAAESFGLSRREALAAAGTFGNLFRTIGLGPEVTEKMSVKLVGLAADLAAYSNTDPSQALEALQSGLVGLTRPLRQYGVNLDIATEKQKAMDLGLYSGKGNLTASARAQAAYALILEQTIRQQGNFALTGNNLAQQQKILTAEFHNAEAELGQALVPAMRLLVIAGTDVLKIYNRLPNALQAGIPAVSALALVAPRIVRGYKSAADSLVNFRLGLLGVGQEGAGAAASLGGWVSSVGGLGAAAGIAAPVVVGLGAAAYAFSVDAHNAEERAKAMRTEIEKLEQLATSTGKSTGDVFSSTTLRRFTKENKDDLRTLGISAGELKTALLGSHKGFQTFYNDLNQTSIHGSSEQIIAFERLSDGLRDVRGEYTVSRQAVNKQRADLEALGISTDKTAQSEDKEAKILADSLKYRQAVIDAAEAQVTRSHSLYDAKIAEQGTSKALASAIADEATARRAAAGDSDEYRSAVAAIASDQKAETAAARDTTKAVEALTDAREASRRGLRDERLEKERSAIADERAKLALEDSKDALAKIQDDPHSSEREKAQAALDLRDAELSVQDAQNHRADTTADLAKAEAAGIEGADAVVTAKERVASAIDAQGKAEQQTATDTKAAAKILIDAKDRVAAASDAVRTAVLNEAEAQEKIAILAYGAAAGNDAFNASLLRSMQLLDPNSPFVKSLSIYQQVLAGLSGDVDALAAGPNPAGSAIPPARDPDKGPRLTKIPGLANLKGSSSSGVIDNSKHVTVNTKNGPSAKSIADELAFGSN